MSTLQQSSTANARPAPGWHWDDPGRDRRPGEGDPATRARRRGAIQGAVGLAVATALWLVWRSPLAYLAAAIALLLVLLALAAPLTGYARVSRALEAFGRWVGLAVTWLLMGLLFYLLFLPVGLLLRARRSLHVTTGFDRAAPTYWQPTAARTGGSERYQKQF